MYHKNKILEKKALFKKTSKNNYCSVPTGLIRRVIYLHDADHKTRITRNNLFILLKHTIVDHTWRVKDIISISELGRLLLKDFFDLGYTNFVLFTASWVAVGVASPVSLTLYPPSLTPRRAAPTGPFLLTSFLLLSLKFLRNGLTDKYLLTKLVGR